MANFSQNLRLVSEREDSIDAIGAAYSPPTSGTNTVVDDTIIVSTTNTNAQQFPIGFGSYLDGILPPDLATAAGAFSVSMQQVKNISSIPIEKFAQVVTNIETISGLPVNGTSVPVDNTLVNGALPLIALGSGPYGTYTMSDFFGCMTGLPYIGIDILGLINALETPKLYDIYNQLYLAVTWEQATFDVTTEQRAVATSTPGVYDWQYRIIGTTITNPGGGYTRNGAPAPGGDYYFPNGSIAGSGGVLLSTNPDTNSNNVPGTYGRMINLVVANTPGNWVSYGTGGSSPADPDIEYRLPAPPITVSSYPYTGASNSAYGTTGWPGMNSVVQTLINDANIEITTIQASKQRLAEQMNTNWNLTGTQLTIEQRALNTALPVAVPPIDVITDLAQFPTTQYAFTDSVPQYALNTDPHMQAQSIEAMANICSPGGQSIVGMMREARNQARLTQVGISLDNNISDSIPVVENKTLLANGSINNTPPAKLSQVDCTTGNTVNSNPYGFYDPADNNYYVTNPAYLGGGGISNVGNNNGWTGDGQVGGGSTPALPNAVDTGNATAYGSFAGSPYTNVIPANLNVLYTSNNLLPSTYTIPEAIDEVIRCNCDCWDMI